MIFNLFLKVLAIICFLLRVNKLNILLILKSSATRRPCEMCNIVCSSQDYERISMSRCASPGTGMVRVSFHNKEVDMVIPAVKEHVRVICVNAYKY